MSRIANSLLEIPSGVEVTVKGRDLTVKGSKGELNLTLHEVIEINQEANVLSLKSTKPDRKSGALAGTFRSIIGNMVKGVSEGFVKELQLQGVGYRAQVSGNKLNLTLGFSHPVEYAIPEGVEIETPTPTQVLVRGVNKELVGQVSAEIRAFRPPEPYKGKGVRYVDEYVKRKEAKKK
jgi:large subunit ribosomal protein L6